jgi:hypothetical protein
VVADMEGLQYRTLLGWRRMPWSTIVGLQVGSAAGKFRIYPIWIVRRRGRSLRPLALASDSAVDAKLKVELLRSIAPGVALIE